MWGGMTQRTFKPGEEGSRQMPHVNMLTCHILMSFSLLGTDEAASALFHVPAQAYTEVRVTLKLWLWT